MAPVSSTTAIKTTTTQAKALTERQRLGSFAARTLTGIAQLKAMNQRPGPGNRVPFQTLQKTVGANLANLRKDIPTFKDKMVIDEATKALAYYGAEYNHQVWAGSKLTGLTSAASTAVVPKPEKKAALEAAKKSFLNANVSRDSAMRAMGLPIGDPMKTNSVEQTSKLLFAANRNITKSLDDVRKALLAGTTMGEIVAYLGKGSNVTLEKMLTDLAKPLANATNTYTNRLADAVRRAKASNSVVTVTTVDRAGVARTTTKNIGDSQAVSALANKLNNNLEAFGAAGALSATSAQLMNVVIVMSRSIPQLNPRGMATAGLSVEAQKEARAFDAWSRTANFNAVITSSQNAYSALRSVDTEIRKLFYSTASDMAPHRSGQTTILANTVREVMSALYAGSTKSKSLGAIATISNKADGMHSYFIETINLDTRDQRMRTFYEQQYRTVFKLAQNNVSGTGTGPAPSGYTFSYTARDIAALRSNASVVFFKGNSDLELGNYRYYFNQASVDVYAKPFASLRYFPFSLNWKANGTTANIVKQETSVVSYKKPLL